MRVTTLSNASQKANALAKEAAAQGYEAAANALEGRDPRLEAALKRAADPNVGMPKRVIDDGIDPVEDAPRNMVGSGTRTATGYERGLGR